MAPGDAQKPGAFRMLAITPFMGATSVYRAGVSYANAWYKQAPRLAGLWFDAVEPGGDQVASATDLRLELLQTTRESVKGANDELMGGIADLERFGAPPGGGSRTPPVGGGPPPTSGGTQPPTGPGNPPTGP